MNVLYRPSSEGVFLALVYAKTKSADDVFARIYLVNPSATVYHVRTKGDFWQTVDESSGEAIAHGPTASEHELKPSQAAKVGEVLGWELDSALGFDVWLRKEGEREWTYRTYDLKGGGQEQMLPVLKKLGVIRKPMNEKRGQALPD